MCRVLEYWRTKLAFLVDLFELHHRLHTGKLLTPDPWPGSVSTWEIFSQTLIYRQTRDTIHNMLHSLDLEEILSVKPLVWYSRLPPPLSAIFSDRNSLYSATSRSLLTWSCNIYPHQIQEWGNVSTCSMSVLMILLTLSPSLCYLTWCGGGDLIRRGLEQKMAA